MKLKLILTTAIVGMALALPSVSSAAPPPPPTFQDSVSLTEAPAVFEEGGVDFGFLRIVQELTATSGPSGENPTGEIMWSGVPRLIDRGPITCLAVSGNTATFNYVSSLLAGRIVTAQVVDNSPDTFSQFFVLGRAATDCSPPPLEIIAPLDSGDIKVVDAQVPTTKDQCKGDGWKQIGFANQGLCLAFVNHGP
jgi:hypothetical protein